MTTNNHPANGPVSLARLHQISEILSKAAAQSDGGNLGYAMADGVKVIDGVIAAHNEEPVAYMTYKGYLLHAGDPKVSEYSEPTPLYTATPAPVVLYSANGLMPCPFCGGKAHQLTIEQDNDPHFGGDVITCTECGASSHVEFGFKENLKSAWNSRAAMLQAGNVGVVGKTLTVTLPDTSSKAFWSGSVKNEVFYPETYKRWVKEAIERACVITGISVVVK